MFSKLKKLNREGFTIIEVMIVLAIAALILLIVLLAVPALQRSSRNTQRKSDVSGMASAISNFMGNNNGAIPTAEGYVTADKTSVAFYCSGATPSTPITAGTTVAYTTANCSTTNTNSEQAKIGFYDLTTANIQMANTNSAPTVGTPSSAPSRTNVTVNSVVIDLGYQCDPSSPSGAPVSNPRSTSIYYVNEAGGSANGNLACVTAT
jgi:prepilin-type N-terminal cleavage/methylation domain-containing protein